MNAAPLDLEELTRALNDPQRLGHAPSKGTGNLVNGMESNMSHLLNCIENLETPLNSGQDTTHDGHRTPDVILETDTDCNTASGLHQCNQAQ